MSIGAAVFYETENSIKEVVFFYKSDMLNYSGSLENVTSIEARVMNYPRGRKDG